MIQKQPMFFKEVDYNTLFKLIIPKFPTPKSKITNTKIHTKLNNILGLKPLSNITNICKKKVEKVKWNKNIGINFTNINNLPINRVFKVNKCTIEIIKLS